MHVDIVVNSALREFLVAQNNGSEIFELEKSGLLNHKINLLLEKVPSDFRFPKSKENLIRIKLTYLKIGNNKIYPQSKCYLSENSQKIIAADLYKVFKEVFHNYVLSHHRAGKKVSDGIHDFCKCYNIPMNKLNYEMLKKSWDRSKEKKLIKNRTFCQ